MFLHRIQNVIAHVIGHQINPQKHRHDDHPSQVAVQIPKIPRVGDADVGKDPKGHQLHDVLLHSPPAQKRLNLLPAVNLLADEAAALPDDLRQISASALGDGKNLRELSDRIATASLRKAPQELLQGDIEHQSAADQLQLPIDGGPFPEKHQHILLALPEGVFHGISRLQRGCHGADAFPELSFQIHTISADIAFLQCPEIHASDHRQRQHRPDAAIEKEGQQSDDADGLCDGQGKLTRPPLAPRIVRQCEACLCFGGLPPFGAVRPLSLPESPPRQSGKEGQA